MRVEWNPVNTRADFLDGLNECFPGWGDQVRYTWYFEPREPHPSPDVLVLKEGNQIVAGTGLTYRRLLSPTNRPLRAAILTGSWTLPAWRGRGLFARVVAESRQQALSKGQDVLLAFVREDNPSRRVLEREGALLAPTFYFRADAASEEDTPPERVFAVDPNAALMEDLWQRVARSGETRFRFHYETVTAFASQFIHRHSATLLLRDEAGHLAIVQDDGRQRLAHLIAFANADSASALHFLKGLAASARADGRTLAVFTSPGPVRLACDEAGFTCGRGFVTVMRESGTSLDAPWSVSGGDRS